MREIVEHHGMDAIATALDAGLAALVGEDRAAAWSMPRAGYRPVLTMLVDAGVVLAAAVTTARPTTAATTVVDPWGTDEGIDALIAHLVGEAAGRRDVAVKWASSEPLPAVAIAAGFIPLRRPVGAVGTEGMQGAVRWLEDIPHDEPGYYGQTTLYTCGAVAALIAAGLRGAEGFAADAKDRGRELAFWRRASNFPACEPVGLAVTTAEHLGGGVEVALDADGPVLVEGYTGFDRSFRTELQTESLRRAEELGIPLRRDRVDVAEIATRVAGGEIALLLIDEEPMHGQHGPHWVTAHASDGVDVVVIEDPWVNRESGETWVDVHELPVRLGDLDRLVRWSEAGYRGVVFLTR